MYSGTFTAYFPSSLVIKTDQKGEHYASIIIAFIDVFIRVSYIGRQ